MDDNNIQNIEFGVDIISEELTLDDLGLSIDGIDDISTISETDNEVECYRINVKLKIKTIPIYITSDMDTLKNFIIVSEDYSSLPTDTVFVLPTGMQIKNLGLLTKLVTTYGNEVVKVSVSEIKESYNKDKFETLHINLQLAGGDLNA